MRLAICAALLAAGCATNSGEAIVGPDGRPAYAMKCSGKMRSMEKCFRDAAELCPTGYDIVSQETGAVGVPASGGGMMVAPSRSMLIQCRD